MNPVTAQRPRIRYGRGSMRESRKQDHRAIPQLCARSTHSWECWDPCDEQPSDRLAPAACPVCESIAPRTGTQRRNREPSEVRLAHGRRPLRRRYIGRTQRKKIAIGYARCLSERTNSERSPTIFASGFTDCFEDSVPSHESGCEVWMGRLT